MGVDGVLAKTPKRVRGPVSNYVKAASPGCVLM
jgi:hypothetical protein